MWEDNNNHRIGGEKLSDTHLKELQGLLQTIKDQKEVINASERMISVLDDLGWISAPVETYQEVLSNFRKDYPKQP
jgi:hypothetical protein